MIKLNPGLLIAQRFVIESAAGSGGMGTVFRAHDTQTGCPVALKFSHVSRKGLKETERFTREAQIISELHHPGIVKYVSHGQTEAGQHFLAMEWLPGEDLAQRLRRGVLSLEDALRVLRQSAAALDLAHRRGIIHRDIKPSNIFLCEGPGGKGDLRIVLLDFGISRRVAALTLPELGHIIGTPEYMSPEQACGLPTVLPSADIFSLGSVLFECLVGYPPFTSEHVAGVLAKVLFEDAPQLGSLRPEVPVALGALLATMLAKPAAQRPHDAAALLAKLQELDATVSVEAVRAEPPSHLLLAAEQQLCSVVIAVPPESGAGELATQDTAEVEQNRDWQLGLRGALQGYGARAEWLLDGSLVTALTGGGNATDQVALAAHCALLIKERWPEAAVVLATGRGVVQGRLPVGEAIERATRLLHKPAPAAAPNSATQAHFAGVRLDDLTASLLGGRFALQRFEGDILLPQDRAPIDETRPLLGQPTPCVGREYELRMLDGVLKDCIAESRAYAILIQAAPGIGKSRFRHEFLRRLKSQDTKLEVFVGRGDLIRAGSPYEILGQALRLLCGLQGQKDGALQQAKLRERLGRYLDPKDGEPVVEFLGELCGVQFPDAHCVQLRTARRDPNAMSDWITYAFVKWLRAECSQRPVLLVLEDLHWGDARSIKLIDEALRELSELPLLVFALARPEVNQLFPELWAGRVQQIALRGLGKPACEALVKHVLGAQVERQTIERIVKQAAGNALYLEELIRTTAEQNGGTRPDSVIAMLQARISRLGDGERRVLRAASIFGNSFWRGGILRLLGQAYPISQLDTWLDALIEEEVITRHGESRLAEDLEYGFRHALLRDAAYSLLTDPDRKLGHQAAGVYLEEAGEPDAMSLAEHFRAGDDSAHAVRWYIQAADRGIMGNDLDRAWSGAARGLQCGAQGESLATLQSLQCTVYFWRGGWGDLYPIGCQALPLLPHGGVRWCGLLGQLLISAGHTGRAEAFAQLAQRCTEINPEPAARSNHMEAVAKLVAMFTILGARAAARGCLERLGQLAALQGGSEADYFGWLPLARSVYARSLEATPFHAMAMAQESVTAFHRAGSLRNWLIARAFLGITQYEAGQVRDAEVTLRDAVSGGQRLGEFLASKSAGAYLAFILASRTDRAQAAEAESTAMEIIVASGLPNGSKGTAYCALALIAKAAGDLPRAESYCAESRLSSAGMPLEELQVLTALIKIHLLQANLSAARDCVSEGMQRVTQVECAGYAEVPFRLAAAEFYAAVGESEAAHHNLRETIHQLELRAASFPDPAMRASYLSTLPDNVRALTLARSWLGGAV